jgi:hypothetical protein
MPQRRRFSQDDLAYRERKVTGRQHQAEAKGHKIGMLQQRQEYRHSKRMQDLEYWQQRRESGGFTGLSMPQIGLGIGALIVGGFLFF